MIDDGSLPKGWDDIYVIKAMQHAAVYVESRLKPEKKKYTGAQRTMV